VRGQAVTAVGSPKFPGSQPSRKKRTTAAEEEKEEGDRQWEKQGGFFLKRNNGKRAKLSRNKTRTSFSALSLGINSFLMAMQMLVRHCIKLL